MRTTISAMLLALLFTGWTANGTENGKTLSMGMSAAEISSNFKGPGIHQFSAQQESNVFRCVSYSFGDYSIRYYFVFKNDELISILDAQPFFANAFETKPNPDPKHPSTKISVRKPWQAEDFMTAVLQATTISPEVLSEQIKTRLESARGGKTSYNVLPAFVILAPLIVPDMLARNKKYETWLNTYDPFKAKVGARRSDIESVYGKPHFVVHHDATKRSTHAYGPPEVLWRDKARLYLGPLNSRFWTAVVYENDVAVRIFSHDLFNDEDIVSLQNEVKQ